ncbi:TPA: hypothetical protein ACPVER_004452 [Escherichia coli]
MLYVFAVHNNIEAPLATPSADNSQLVINALTDKGLRFAGYGEAVNHDADSTNLRVFLTKVLSDM